MVSFWFESLLDCTYMEGDSWAMKTDLTAILRTASGTQARTRAHRCLSSAGATSNCATDPALGAAAACALSLCPGKNDIETNTLF